MVGSTLNIFIKHENKVNLSLPYVFISSEYYYSVISAWLQKRQVLKRSTKDSTKHALH